MVLKKYGLNPQVRGNSLNPSISIFVLQLHFPHVSQEHLRLNTADCILNSLHLSARSKRVKGIGHVEVSLSTYTLENNSK